MEDGGTSSVVVGEPLALVREGMAALCERTGRLRVVGQCGDGREALELIRRHRPELALLDFDLPKLFSLEVVRQAREGGAATRVIIVSQRTDRKTVLEVLRSGAGGYLLKSDPLEALLTAFRQVLSGGVYISPQVEMARIFTGGNGDDHRDPLETLSRREFQVYSLLVEGLRAKEIAARLELSPKTVDTYRANLMRKLDIYDLAGLVKFALRRNQDGAAR